MRRTIWKFPIQTTGQQAIEMSLAATILCVQTQQGNPCIWAMVNGEPNHPKETRKFNIYGTGHPLPDDFTMPYIGTYQLEGGALVFHVFENLTK